MKKILIVNNNMHIGGVQKALVNLLWNIREQYDITLLLFSERGAYLADIPPQIRVITAQSYEYLGMTRNDDLRPWQKAVRGIYGAVTRIFGRKLAVSCMALGQKTLSGYDVAISYLHNSGEKVFYGGCNDFVLRHVQAGKKVAFLHGDYGKCGANTRENARQYAHFDVIAACSQGCADSFLQANPQLKEKVKVVSNCHRFDQIAKSADEAPVSLCRDKINIVTVARLGKEKGVERALRVLSRIGQCREQLHYYIVGDGIQKPLLQQILQEENLQDTVTLCGMLTNPYGYIRAADLLWIPSYSEAAPLVIGEAASLGTPVLSTETSSAREMVEDTGYGWVCENTQAAMEQAVTALLAQPDELRRKQQQLPPIALDNSRAVAEFANCVT